MASTDEESLLDGDGPAGATCGLCCVCIPTGSVGVVQALGKYVGYVDPGMTCYCNGYHSIQTVSLALQQIECSTECKTKDNVTLRIKTAVTYRINRNMLKTAVFDIEDALSVIEAQVDNIVRSSLPAMDLDDAYSNKEGLCNDILKTVRSAMAVYGYDIENVLVVDLSPEQSVLTAMNQINAARRNRAAAAEEAEAQKIMQVKAAEADAEAKYLSGMGVARMRKAMAEGVHESMQAMSQGGLTPQEAMHMMVTTQYLDTLKDFANNPTNSAIMVPSGAGAAADLQSQVRSGFIEGQALAPRQATMGR
jgi:regulator of protease activity HflC (stomatin/prohibitin superfamily)